MNLEELKKRVLARKGKAVDVPEWGLSVTFLPIGFHRGIDIFKRFGELPRSDAGHVLISEESVAVFVDAIAASASDEAGDRFLDSGDGRKFLKEQSISVLEKLTKAALNATGIQATSDDEIKNSATPAATGE